MPCCIAAAARTLYALGCLTLLGPLGLAASLRADAPVAPKPRRILYNLDGDSCLTLKAGRQEPGPVTTEDLRLLVAELTPPGSHVDTLLVCVNAQVMYYPTQAGTLRGTLATEAERAQWPPGERQRFANVRAWFAAGVDPYAVLLAEARKRGLETLLTFRMNDAHGNDFLRTAFWRDHPECRLGNGALDFTHAAVRDYVFALIEEAMQRYDCDGLELDFQRFPRFFPDDPQTPPDARLTEERVAKLTGLVGRVRQMLTALGERRGRRLLLAARVPSDFGRAAPSYARARALGCDPVIWARKGWLDFLTVSEFLFVRYDLPIRPWKDLLPGLPVYGGIECAEGGKLEQCLTPAKYRRAARHLWRDGADGIYLFNFFTTREWATEAFEPPFEVLRELGDPAALAQQPVGPWETNRPIATVTRLLYQRHPGPRAAAMVARQYVGPNLELREWQGRERVSDVAEEQRARWSLDNGRTWSEWVPQQPSSLVDYGGVKASEGGWGDLYDPASGRLVQLWLRQFEVKGLFHNFTYCRTSTDLGRSWSAPEPLRYEAGEDFDPREPLRPAFLAHNQGYPGNSLLRRRDGTLVAVLAHANAPGDPDNAKRPWRMGSVSFLGRWDQAAGRYDWRPGKPVEISPTRSARGLMEPDAAELSDGRLLVVWRGSDTGWDGTVAREPGRKWFSLSTDGSRTLGPVEEWRYDDGARFYSPSSIHRFLRHGVTQKLYWIGNLCLTPPRGNHPRYPLILAEVDEEKAALRRSSVTVIDDRAAHQGRDVQFSNFSLLENRETHALELHLTTYGQEPDPQDWATADNWKYTITLGE